MAYSAFDQFEITRIIPLHLFGNLDISITNSTIFMLIGTGTFYWIYMLNVEEGPLVPGRWQSIIEIVYENMLEMVKDNIGKEGMKYFPLILTIFTFIAMMNMYGIVPYTFTPTSHFAVTIGMSLSIFIGVTILGLINYRSNYFSMFMPLGAPIVAAPFLVIIELISHLIKPVSLGVRLAANITAGHLLFTILSGFAWTMLTAGGLITLASIFPIVIVFFITLLEMAVALIQAYVFSLLTTIYLSESINLH